MGEAKRRALSGGIRVDQAINQRVIKNLSSAIRRLAEAASEKLGGDCFIHAAIGQAILAKVGIESKIVCGVAAWRVGPENSDVILHASHPGSVVPDGSLPYHVWLAINDYILDLTTYQLRLKTALLNELDGGTTAVEWCPDFIFAHRRTISTRKEVVQLNPGMYYYERDLAIEQVIMAEAPVLDEDDVDLAWMLYQDQDLTVFGPNHCRFLNAG